MKLRIPTSTAVALGLLAGGLLAVASVKAQSGGTLTQQRTQSQNQLRSDQLSPGALQQERLMSQERIQSQQMLRDGAGPSGSAYQNQLQNQQRQRWSSLSAAARPSGVQP